MAVRLAAPVVSCTATRNTPEHDDEDTLAAALLAVLSTEDLLEKIGQYASDPLKPSTACALAACNRSLAKVMRAPLVALRPRHVVALVLAVKVGESCAALRAARQLKWSYAGLTTSHARTLGMLLGLGSMPLVQELDVFSNGFGDEGMVALCKGLQAGAAPRLVELNVAGNEIGPDSAAALAAALGRGGLPGLQRLFISCNRLGAQGLAALAVPLRQQCPSLRTLDLSYTGISDDSVAALVGGLGVRELKALSVLFLEGNPIFDVGCAALTAALDSGALPDLAFVDVTGYWTADDAARQAVRDAMAANRERRLDLDALLAG